jgi:hypothetical protein
MLPRKPATTVILPLLLLALAVCPLIGCEKQIEDARTTPADGPLLADGR